MHYHLEIIMPPVANVAESVEQIIKPFCEGQRDEGGVYNSHTFYDWSVIGGRWAGAKLEEAFDAEKKKEFFAALTERGVTVSGLQAGKQELSPKEQIPVVDALFNEFFPDSPVKVCPFFNHFNDQYKDSEGWPDVMTLEQTPLGMSASRVIIAAEGYSSPELRAEFMVADSEYNGVTFVKTVWDGTLQGALDMHAERIKNYREEAREKYTPKADWLVVTVDIHN